MTGVEPATQRLRITCATNCRYICIMLRNWHYHCAGHPVFPWCHQSERSFSHRTDVPGPCSLVPLIGFEPMSNGLKGRCSTTEPKAVYTAILSFPIRTPSTVGYNRLIEVNRNALQPFHRRQGDFRWEREQNTMELYILHFTTGILPCH